MSNKVLISEEELQYLKACDFTLHRVNNAVGLCPACKKAILVDGLVCLNCDYDRSYTLEEWEQIKNNRRLNYDTERNC